MRNVLGSPADGNGSRFPGACGYSHASQFEAVCKKKSVRIK